MEKLSLLENETEEQTLTFTEHIEDNSPTKSNEPPISVKAEKKSSLPSSLTESRNMFYPSCDLFFF